MKLPDLYKTKPLRLQDDIPVFSERDPYIENYERIAHDHLEHFEKTGENPWIDEKLWNDCEAPTLKQLTKFQKEGDRILDVGVGTGRLLSKLSKPAEKYGLDISIQNLRICKEKGIDGCLAKIEDIPYSNEMFDIVIATDILEHLIDLHCCVKKILAVLKKGGFLIVRVPYRENLEGYLSPKYPYKYAHLRNFDEFGLQLFFEKEMNCKFLEYNFGGYYLQPQRLKWGHVPPRDSLALRIADYLIQRFYRNIKAKNYPYYVDMHWPLEISCVIQKA